MPGTTFNDERSGTYIPPVSFLYVENLTEISKKDSEKGHFNVFFKKTSKRLLKRNSLVKGFLLPGTAFNDKLNGTYPSTVSFLYVENLTKKNQKMVLPVLRFLGLPCMAMPGPPIGHTWVKFGSKKAGEAQEKWNKN